MSRKEDERKFARIEDCVEISIQEPEEHIKNSKDVKKTKLVTAASNSNDNSRTNRKQ